jgi:hypothetical protein
MAVSPHFASENLIGAVPTITYGKDLAWFWHDARRAEISGHRNWQVMRMALNYCQCSCVATVKLDATRAGRRLQGSRVRDFGKGLREALESAAEIVIMSISAVKTSSIIGLMFFMGIAAASHAQATKPAPPTPIDEKKVELGGTPWNPQWDEIIEKAMPPEMLSSQVPRGVRRFCPRFYEISETEKRVFWAYFFQALAGAEAGLNPNTSVRHNVTDVAKRDEVTGKTMRSEGLLQLAYADQKRYGCNFDWQVDRALKVNDPAKTILQPKNNLECGVKILVKQTIIQHKPLLTRSGYWSTLRPDGPSYRVFAKQMSNPPAACRLLTKSTIDKSATTKSVQDDVNRGGTPK